MRMPTADRNGFIVALLLTLLVVTTAGAQNFGGAPSFAFDWEVTSSGGRPALAGYVHNHNVWKITAVRIAVDILDASGTPIGKGSCWVVGDIAEGAKAYFIVRLPTVGARYRPFVESFDFLGQGRG